VRLGGRLAAAIEILTDIESRRRPAATALKDWGVAHRFAGSGDRSAIGNLVYDGLRWRSSSAYLADDDDARLALLAMVRHRWGLNADELAFALSSDPHAPEPQSEAQLAAFEAHDLALAPGHVQADIPEWLAPHLEETFGHNWIEEGAASALRPPLDLRVNRLKADRNKVMGALRKFDPVEAVHAVDGLRIAPTVKAKRHPNVQVEPAFMKGWFEIQDEGSQLAAAMIGAQPGEKILDLCAGAGGKTLALSATMTNKGQIFATDADRVRLAPIYDRSKRAGTRNVQIRPAGDALDDLAGKLDAVLIDVPCTGTGTWRRRPDSKWRLRPEAVAVRATEQSNLLDTAADLVRPGGRLVYITCSFFPEENTTQIGSFLERRGDYRARESKAVAATAGLDAASAYLSPTGVLLSPGRTGTDAFFVAVLERAAS
jgi:16S rRNA (cytosine967-C5)-methyltransferase